MVIEEKALCSFNLAQGVGDVFTAIVLDHKCDDSSTDH
jgi:hypothetical protein